MATRKPWIKDRQTAVIVGIGLYLAGSIVLYDAYEHRGRGRPFGLRFLPGA